MEESLTIGICDCSKYPNYERWMTVEGVRVIKIGYQYRNFDRIEDCHGIILTGGEDVDPSFYNKREYLSLCHEVDAKRDEFEMKMLEYTEFNKVPVLGICRGLQVINVFFKGTLIPDMPTFGKPDHAAFPDKDRYHEVKTEAAAGLVELVGQMGGEINSAHHQTIDRLGDGLRVNAMSSDGIVEGIERHSGEGQGFLLLVQWHPERMTDQNSNFVRNVKQAFLEAARKRKV